MEEKDDANGQYIKLFDLIYDMQREALAYLVTGSTEGLEKGIKKMEVLHELRERGIFPYKK